ncbi:MAG TPA: cytochrome c [Kofleriaceae bacterium]|nr:cytochrome c [Kofleriaceae bacterium]
MRARAAWRPGAAVVVGVGVAATAAVLAAGCDWSLHRMQRPVGCRHDGATTMFADGRCDRLPAEGAVPVAESDDTAPAVAPSRAVLDRGRDRFDRYCAPCHGLAADGDSEVARAMELRRPPSLVDDTAVRFPDERYLAVIAAGYGLMPAYGALLAPRDRVAIVHYLRALQGRDVPIDALAAGERAEAEQWLP